MNDIDRFLEGLGNKDVTAFKQVYQRYYKPMVLFAMRFVEDQQVAEDVVEDVIVAVWENGKVFESKLMFEGYIYNSVRNKCINVLRHSNAHARYECEMKALEDGFHIDIEDADAFEMQYVRLFEAMDELPNRCREVLELYIEGLSNADIAERLALSIETVKTHRKRALAMLRERLQNVVLLLFYLHFFNI